MPIKEQLNGNTQGQAQKFDANGNPNFLAPNEFGQSATPGLNIGTISVNPNITNPTSILSNPTTNQDIQNALAKNQELRQQYLQSLAPTQTQQDLQSQLNAIREQAQKQNLSFQAGFDAIGQEVKPMEFITGEQQALSQQNQRQLQTLAAQEQALATRLGVENDYQVAKQKALATGLDFASQDINLLQKMQDSAQAKENELWNRMIQYNTVQRNAIADTLDSLKGIDPSKLSYTALAQIETIAGQRGINPQDIISGLQSEYDKTSLDTLAKQMSIAKTRQDLQTGSGNDLATLLSYAQEYVSSGKIPTGIPKGTFGIVSQLAKEVDKPEGFIYDKSTGTNPGTKLSATQADGIASLYDLSKKLVTLEEYFKKINTGAGAGSISLLFPTENQTRYNDLRSEIVDLIARARTGAALTASEEDFYKSKLPSTFNKAFGLGASGETKIEDLLSSISGKLKTTLDTKGLAISGTDFVDGKVIYNGDIVTKGGKKYLFNNGVYTEQ